MSKDMPEEIWVDKVLTRYNVWKGYDRPAGCAKYIRADKLEVTDCDSKDVREALEVIANCRLHPFQDRDCLKYTAQEALKENEE